MLRDQREKREANKKLIRLYRTWCNQKSKVSDELLSKLLYFHRITLITGMVIKFAEESVAFGWIWEFFPS